MNNDKRVAPITEASSGIGRVTALALKQAGYRVFGTNRKAASSDVGGITMLVCDVTDETTVQQMVAEVMKQAGRIESGYSGRLGTHGNRNRICR